MSRNQTSGGGRKIPDRESTDGVVPWLAWLLQLAVGFLVGCGVGYQVARLLFRSYFHNIDQMLFLAAAIGLVCGAFTSFYGNRAWMATSIFLAPEPAPPRKARACSLIIGGIGVAIMLLVVLAHWIAAPEKDEDATSLGFDAFLLLAAVIPGFLLVHALRTGTGFWRFGIVAREEMPLLFWIYVVLNTAMLLSILSML